MSNYDDLKPLIEKISGQAAVITVLGVYVDICDDFEAALVLSQCIFWSGKGHSGDGWFYKSRDEWRNEVGIKRYALQSAVGRLEQLGVLETKVEPGGHNSQTICYRVDMDRLTTLVAGHLQGRFAEISKSNARSAESCKSDLQEAANPSAESCKSSYSCLHSNCDC